MKISSLSDKKKFNRIESIQSEEKALVAGFLESEGAMIRYLKENGSSKKNFFACVDDAGKKIEVLHEKTGHCP